MTQLEPIDINDIVKEIKHHVKRTGFTKSKIEAHLITKYHKTKILTLNDDELLEFLDFCRRLKPFSRIIFKPIKFKKLSKELGKMKLEQAPIIKF